jgi:gamma-glutamyltranspeptidase/glutathione hydrolase
MLKRKISQSSMLKVSVWLAALTSVSVLPGSGADIASATCTRAGASNPVFCNALRGDRAEGWLAQGRSETMARNGMVTTSQPLAAEAGLEILRRGGNAVDAAVATAAALNLMEPMNEGLAGDLFAIIYTAKDHKLHVLNASGMAASGQTAAFMNAHGYKFDPRNDGPGSGMPRAGVLTVTVPGAAWGWAEVLEKYGSMKLPQVLAPAIDYAYNGFPISERIANDWHLPNGVNANRAELAKCCTEIDPDSIKTWYINGKQPKAGDIFRNRDLAKTLRLLAQHGKDGFYKGPVAEALIAKVHALGGTMTMEDMANYKGEWVEPVESDYHGFRIAELPPPANGFATNEMLNVLSACTGKVYPGQTLASLGPTDARYWHMLIEAKTLAYQDVNANDGDPHFSSDMDETVKRLTSMDYAESLCSKISPDKAMPMKTGSANGDGDTIVLSTADRWGNMVSWVNSNFGNFGSGVTVPGYGFILHNRGALFTLDPKNPNLIAPHKRPYNTLAAGFVMQNGRFDGQLMTLLLMGGDMQAQGHAQMMVNMVDLGANLQAASDMARFHHNQVADSTTLETEAFKAVGAALQAMGHKVSAANGSGMGGYQAILFTPAPGEPKPDGKRPVNGYYRAGTDHRKDGISIGW